MLSNLDDLFKKMEQGDDTVGAILIDQLGADLETEVDRSGGRRRLLDAVLRAPSRELFDKACAAFETTGSGRYPETHLHRWSSWLRDDTFSRESYATRGQASTERHGALVAAMEGFHPWAIEEILDRENALRSRSNDSYAQPAERNLVSMINMTVIHGLGRRAHNNSDENLLNVLKLVHQRFPGDAQDWMVPVTLGFQPAPAAIVLAAAANDERVVKWFVEELGLPLNMTTVKEETWATGLVHQSSLIGITWLLDQGFDWDQPSRIGSGFDDASDPRSLHEWINRKANHPLGDRPDHWENGPRWDADMAFQQRIQALLLRYENPCLDAPARVDRPRL